jgi:hypothetical protein
MAWFKRFYDPIVLPNQCRLMTLRDAAEYIAALPPAERHAARWQIAMESLTLAAETDASIELARTAVMMALDPVRTTL